MIGLALSFFLRSRTGNFVGLALLAALAFGTYTAFIRADAKDDALTELEEINNDLANQAIDARDAAARCRADDRLRWDFAAVRCVKRDQSAPDS